MSTSFHVHPGTPRIPAVGEVHRGEMARFVTSRAVKMRAAAGTRARRWSDPFWCEPAESLWITADVPEHPGRLWAARWLDDIEDDFT